MWEGPIGELAEEQIAALGRSAELGQYQNFDQAVGKLRLIREIVEVADRHVDYLVSGQQRRITDALAEALVVKSEIAGFDQNVQDAAGVRTRIISRVDNALDEIRGAAVVAFGVEAVQQSAPKTAELESLLADTKAKAASIDKIYREVQPKSATIGGKRLADYYESQGKAYRIGALWALAGAGVSLAAVALIALNPDHRYGPDPAIDPTSQNALIEWLVAMGPRLVLGGLALYALRFFARLHSVRRHLEAVNLHRRNALDTFVLFSEGSPTPEAAQTVLTALAGAIFRDPETGFIPGDSKVELPGGISIPTS